MATYYTPDTLAGQTLRDLASKYGFRSDVLANFAGISESSPLTAGQKFNLPAEYGANSSEGGFASRNFTPGETYLADKAKSDQAAAVAPAIQTLQAGIDPLKDRYAKLIADIKGRRETAVQQVGIDTAREFGKRGIPTSSGAYDVALRGAQTPVEQSYAQAETGAAGEEQDRIRAIQTAIAGLQAGAGKDAITQALQMLQMSQSQSQFDKSYDLQKSELEKKYASSPESLKDKYIALSEGQTLYDLAKNVGLYTAPKTYKVASGGGGNSAYE